MSTKVRRYLSDDDDAVHVNYTVSKFSMQVNDVVSVSNDALMTLKIRLVSHVVRLHEIA